MPSSSSSRPKAVVVRLLLGGLAPLLVTCAVGLDFDSLSNECSHPRFDLPNAERFCDGLLVAGPNYAPTGMGIQGFDNRYVDVDALDGYLAAVMISEGPDESDSGCRLITFSLNVGRLDDDGVITTVDHVNGGELGYVFRVDDGGCARPDAELVWPVEARIASVQDFDGQELIHVLVSFASGGLFQAFFGSSTGLIFLHHVAGDDRASTRRSCLLGACVTDEEEFCLTNADCHPSTFCAPTTSVCTALAEGCTLDFGCSADNQGCAALRSTCAIRCEEDSECPHPYRCEAGLCGGEGCGTDTRCLAGENECIEGACTATCTAEAPACSEDRGCFGADDPPGVCALGGVTGACSIDADCSLSATLGFAVTAPGLLTLNTTGLAFATSERGLRLGFFSATGRPYLFPGSQDSAPDSDILTDLVFVDDLDLLYGTVANFGVVRLDWDAAGEDGELRFDSYPLGPDVAAPLVRITNIGGYLLTHEGAFPGERAVPGFSRVLQIDADPDTDLQQMGQRLALGSTRRISVGPLGADEDVWVFGVDRSGGGELIVYDMRDPATPELLGTLFTGNPDGDERDFVSVTPEGIFVANRDGVRQYLLTRAVEDS